MASRASGMTLPPRISTPSISKANANLSVTRVSPEGVEGAEGVDVADLNSSNSCLAISMEAATSCASDGAIKCFGGTTTVGPRTEARSSLVAVWELTRRSWGLLGTASFGADIFATDVLKDGR